jgi:hypothetical protein
MSAPVATLLTQQYTDSVELLLQQSGPRLRDAVMVKAGYIGEAANPVDQVGQVKPTRDPPRNSDTPVLSLPTDRRWVYPHDYVASDLIDQFDQLRTVDQLTNPCVQAGAMAVNRAQDDEVLLASLGTAQTGKTGATATSLPAGQQIAANFGAAGNTGLTVAKLRKARQLLMSAGADWLNDPMYCAVTTLDHDSMLAETQIINSDYSGNVDRPALVDGIVQRFLGINFVIVEFTDTVYSASTTMGQATRLVPLWVKSGLHLGLWNDTETKIDQRPDKNYSYQWYVRCTVGATRLQEKKMVQISTV